MYNVLEKYEWVSSYGKLDCRGKIGLVEVKRDMESGEYCGEDMKKVFKLKDEKGDK